MTSWLPDMETTSGPKYAALADAIARAVRCGALAPGERLPTHRELADALGVNVSTVTRGYAEAERRGLVAATVGRGTFVASDASTSVPLVSHEPLAPGVIEMGLATPLYALDPDVGAGLRALARRRDLGVLLHYVPPGGLPAHRAAGADWARRFGLAPEPDEVVVCAGAQHALTSALGGLFRPGERIAAAALTYPGMKTLAAMLGIRLSPIALDAEGMLPESLDAVCRRDEVRGVFVIPDAHNPTTATMPEERRRALVEVARRHDLTIVEDSAYALTLDAPPPPLARLAPERTVHVASVSKAFGAGLRVAFAVAPAAMARRMALAVLNTVWMTPPLNVELAALWIKDGTADRVVAAKCAELARRNALAERVLAEFDCVGLRTGFLRWLRLPEPWTGGAFEAACRAAGANVFGAERFAVGDTPPPAAARISVSAAMDAAELRRGLEILADVLRRGVGPQPGLPGGML
ncbi:MAG: PLP-dependent aminotransferase family protein [Desulfovibrionaceae bacterium]|jgi:DNA-binding transcriptional MocR family regulator|nr:PLP-dependent aminotransferase family protein [Desulfovibrionaceae bacterium]